MTSPRTIAIVPARSGSKGLPDKNIRPMNGRPLLAHTVDVALESGIFDAVFVSTDSERYAEIARQAGASVPFLRPAALATDDASGVDVYEYTLDRLAREQPPAAEIFFVLQPTSPLRRAAHLREVREKLLASPNHRALVSVSPLEHPLAWVNTLPEDLCMRDFLAPGIDRINRQEHRVPYRLNGSIFAAEVDYFRAQRSFHGESTYAYVMEPRFSIDIDSELDFEVAQILQRRGSGAENV